LCTLLTRHKRILKTLFSQRCGRLVGKRTRFNVIFEQTEKKQKKKSRNMVLWPARVHNKCRVYMKQKFEKKNKSFEQCRGFLNGLQRKQ